MTTTHSTLRLLVIGAGRMGRTHLEAITSSTAAAAVAVVDPAPEAKQVLAGRNLAFYDQLDHALDAGGFDAALVAAPSGLHLGLVDALMAARVPTLCEKPCGLSAAETRRAAELADDSATLLQIGYWRRYVPALRELREEIADGLLGDIALAHAWQWDGEPPAPQFRQSSGGILVDMGVHEFDQLRWLTGQEITLRGVVESNVFEPPLVEGDPESVFATGTLSGGGVAGVSLGRRYDRGDACWAEFIGTRASRRCEFMMGPDADDVFHTALANQIDAFVEAVGGSASDGATAADAVAALTIAEMGDVLTTRQEQP